MPNKKKIAMLGMWGVGKTSLVRQFVYSIFNEKYLSTIGVTIDQKIVATASQEIKMMIWDIAGAEESCPVRPSYVQGAAGYLLVVDGTREESVDSAREIVELVENKVGKLPFVITINKSDLEWEVSELAIETQLQPLGCPILRTSAKTGENVELAFSTLAELVMQQ